MDPAIYTWPSLLAPKVVRRKRLHTVNTGPETIAGPPQSVMSDAGRWQFDYSGLDIYGDKLLTFRAVIAEISAPLKPIYVPVRDYRHSPRTRARLAFWGATAVEEPFDDGLLFAEDVGFVGTYSDFKLKSDVPERSSSFTVVKTGPANVNLTAGNYIGIDDRTYVLKTVKPSVSGVAEEFDVTIWPYTRADHTADTILNTEDPVLKCTLDPKQLEIFDNLDYDFLGQVDISFVEARW
jgi:hypothetical protein